MFPESWYTCIPSSSTRVCPALFATNGQWLNDYCVWWGKGSPKFFSFPFLVSPSESNLLHAFIFHLFFTFQDIYRLAFSSYYLSILSIFISYLFIEEVKVFFFLISTLIDLLVLFFTWTLRSFLQCLKYICTKVHSTNWGKKRYVYLILCGVTEPQAFDFFFPFNLRFLQRETALVAGFAGSPAIMSQKPLLLSQLEERGDKNIYSVSFPDLGVLMRLQRILLTY